MAIQGSGGWRGINTMDKIRGKIDGRAGAMVRRAALSVFMILLLLTAIGPVQAGNMPNGPGIANSSTSTYIVVFNDTPQHLAMSQGASDLITSYGGRVKYRYQALDGLAITMPDDRADRLKSLPDVKYVEKDQEVHILLDQAVPRIGAEQVWTEG